MRRVLSFEQERNFFSFRERTSPLSNKSRAQSDLFIFRNRCNVIHNHPDAFYSRDGLFLLILRWLTEFCDSRTVEKMIIDDRQITENRKPIATGGWGGGGGNGKKIDVKAMSTDKIEKVTGDRCLLSYKQGKLVRQSVREITDKHTTECWGSNG